MRVLVTGAYGFIGKHITQQLQLSGCQVIAAGRNPNLSQLTHPGAEFLHCDFVHDTDITLWEQRLNQIKPDAVVNCVGVLQTRSKQSMRAIHHLTPNALFTACSNLKIQKIIQISAQGASPMAVTEYGRTKYAADIDLMNLPITGIVLRPSLVYGSGSYGGSSLFRALAVFPGIIPLVGEGNQPLQPIHVEDLAQAVVELILQTDKGSLILDAVGPDIITLRELLQLLRQWLGQAKGYPVKIPLWGIKALSRCWDLIGSGPISSTSIAMLQTSKVVDPRPFQQVIKIPLRAFAKTLKTTPSQVQDRWHAKLYFLSPLLRFCIGLTWVFSGLFPLFSIQNSIGMLLSLGMNSYVATGLFYLSVLIDIFLGLATWLNWRIKLIGLAQIAVMLTYTLILSVEMPSLWLDPFGSLFKNIPLLVATLIMIVLSEER